MSDKKIYTPQEVALAVLAKAREMIEKTNLHKANNAHEVEMGEEPSNEDAECPEYLAEANIEDDYKEDESRKSGKKSSKNKDLKDSEEDSEQPEHEKDMSPEEEKDHDAMENESDEQDADLIEADEEEKHPHLVEETAKIKQKEDDEDLSDEDAEEEVEAEEEKDKKKDKKLDKAEKQYLADRNEKRQIKMSNKEDKKLDQSGEYIHGALGKKEKASEKVEDCEDAKIDLKKPNYKLKKFMMKRKMKKNAQVEKLLGIENKKKGKI